MYNMIIIGACAVTFVCFAVWAKRLTVTIGVLLASIQDKDQLETDLRICKARLSKARLSKALDRHRRLMKKQKKHPRV